jgi:hypothetical protein
MLMGWQMARVEVVLEYAFFAFSFETLQFLPEMSEPDGTVCMPRRESDPTKATRYSTKPDCKRIF